MNLTELESSCNTQRVLAGDQIDLQFPKLKIEAQNPKIAVHKKTDTKLTSSGCLYRNKTAHSPETEASLQDFSIQ